MALHDLFLLTTQRESVSLSRANARTVTAKIPAWQLRVMHEELAKTGQTVSGFVRDMILVSLAGLMPGATDPIKAVDAIRKALGVDADATSSEILAAVQAACQAAGLDAGPDPGPADPTADVADGAPPAPPTQAKKTLSAEQRRRARQRGFTEDEYTEALANAVHRRN
ncbi:MAG TPA: hypothetical protein VH062_09865 [Polyangiaceae bacterium]|jgi:hypothetical protein|nr:hypothetical protein [Polyangiaceae bacterium]